MRRQKTKSCLQRIDPSATFMKNFEKKPRSCSLWQQKHLFSLFLNTTRQRTYCVCATEALGGDCGL